MTLSLPAVLLMIFPVLIILGGLRDAVSYTIPNWISAALVVGFLVSALALGLPPAALGFQVGIGVAGLVLGMTMFALGWIGGGDAKLFAAAALWLGWPAGGTFLLVTGLAGGGLALVLLGLRSNLMRPFVLTGPPWFSRLSEPGESVPYGVAITIGALAAFPSCGLIQTLQVNS
jgi:prepilin peptidase CpaA